MTADNFCSNGNDKEGNIEPKGKAYDSMQKNGPDGEAQGENKGEITDNMEQNLDMSQIIEAKEKEIDNYKNKWLRTQADLENYRKRVERDIQEIHKYAGEKLVKDILPILDNFERALSAIEDKESDLYRGVEMIYEEFKRMLEKHGVKEIEALGKPFDPYYHEAIMTVESNEHEPGIVVEVVRKGYMYNSKVIRPSMVKVSKNN
ncbi:MULTISPECIES: nucleotide exchange factor GrpE [Tepidanaerobacter]|uniref:Protein GrpE n=1 Tax=Tepidanaerobacter syntrophicus TaxID=224999 RepID=A0A0U9HNV0_9FIRM|nr:MULTISPECIES: nucleotide exchange factor GrpE [Tepidanaerobacter]GAQ25553.1 molecular chaperone GrpE [Tepidanaerobacter syntrophicus]GLI18494.1 protein GrpE [Tepidanaerobacter syntrophicus]GLI49989.1 protein GrpE [Tepidanaerobacter syntrophicus]HHV83106.1 nucleotide exchange factor GrpE [Tepidanaerobacter syntrophicus]